MTVTWGDTVTVVRDDVGVGISMKPADPVPNGEVLLNSWQEGMIVADTGEDIPRDAVQLLQDMRIDMDDSLIILEGVTVSEDTLVHNLKYIFQHAAIDYSTELVVIDPPYLGHKAGGNLTWNNLGIDPTGDRGWNIMLYAGTLLFSNGTTSTYTREPNASTVTDISDSIIGETFATQFGRVFAGATTDPLSGLQGLMIQWNGDDNVSPLTDWSSLNSGRELLISGDNVADRVVALRALGFDILAILTRKAVWVGTRTNVANRPADLKLRFPGKGCVAEPTAVVTPHGVAYLGDDGVQLFDGNNVTLLSSQINEALIPLDYLQLNRYKMVYQQYRDRLVLQTPSGSYYYEFPQVTADGTVSVPGRWYRNSYQSDSLVEYVDQSGNVYWNTAVGEWIDQSYTWAEAIQGELNVAPKLYFVQGSKYGYEDSAAFTFMGTAMQSQVCTRQDSKDASSYLTAQEVEIEYSTSVDSNLKFQPAMLGNAATPSQTKKFASTAGKRAVGIFWLNMFMQGTSIIMSPVLLAGKYGLKLYRVRMLMQDSGPLQVTIPDA